MASLYAQGWKPLSQMLFQFLMRLSFVTRFLFLKPVSS